MYGVTIIYSYLAHMYLYMMNCILLTDLPKYFDEPLSQISQILNFVVAYTQYIYTF
jgi:hypothetical protein